MPSQCTWNEEDQWWDCPDIIAAARKCDDMNDHTTDEWYIARQGDDWCVLVFPSTE